MCCSREEFKLGVDLNCISKVELGVDLYLKGKAGVLED